jgi:hypothetical protein
MTSKLLGIQKYYQHELEMEEIHLTSLLLAEEMAAKNQRVIIVDSYEGEVPVRCYTGKRRLRELSFSNVFEQDYCYCSDIELQLGKAQIIFLLITAETLCEFDNGRTSYKEQIKKSRRRLNYLTRIINYLLFTWHLAYIVHTFHREHHSSYKIPSPDEDSFAFLSSQPFHAGAMTGMQYLSLQL